MHIKKVLLLLFIIGLKKKYKGGGVSNEIKQNEQLTKELQKKIIKKIKKGKKKSLNVSAAITRVC